jgi:pectinesterase
MQKCQIKSLASKLGHQRAGFITAQGRENADETSGFVFKNCHVTGSRPINLGRAFAKYARVLFAGTTMDNIITPKGWDAAWSKGSE